MKKSGTLSLIKQKLVSNEASPRTIVAGSFRGIRMNLSLAYQAQIYIGLFERETYPWLKRLSDGIATAVDIGAADGEYTLFLLKNTRASTIYAFEPNPIMASRLHDNLRLNPELRPERLILSTKLVGSSCSSSVIRLDSLAKDIRSPCFIKMDVDGAEEEILSGATAINAFPDVRWLIETHSANLEQACLMQLERMGFRTKVVKNAWWRSILPEQRPIAHNRWLVAWK